MAVPMDVIPGLAVVQALAHLPTAQLRSQALGKLLLHPAHAVRVAAHELSLRENVADW
ncbi:MAG: hypothetical protein JJ693_01470 [Acidithiobacillus sp.]|nr:hypothetical protein [Acidithiobacillus sp.]